MNWARLDIAFGNAGIGGGPGFMGFDGSRNADGEIGSISDVQWDRVMAVNLSSVFTTIQSCTKARREQEDGATQTNLVITKRSYSMKSRVEDSPHESRKIWEFPYFTGALNSLRPFVG
jgi:NAD(P)-dependent dehydrogenase (short-subunit alcohol dehydrogenase family)